MSAFTRTLATWKRLFSQAGFPSYFAGMFVSLFGTGLNFAGVTLYVLARTGSTVQVSLSVILLTLPRLIVPLFGGVLTDRVDRRYLGITLDLLRALVVFGAAALAFSGRLQLWQLYLMVLLLGAGFAVYWSTSLALLQEIIPPRHLIGANAAVLVAVQGGLLAAGAVVGYIYDRAGLASILAIDGATYVCSALCFYHLRKGRALPSAISAPPPVEAEVAERAILAIETSEPSTAVLADITEGLRYLRAQPTVLALGLTYAVMMAGVISANVIVVALAHDLLHAGARGYGFLQAGWALGAVAGGLAALSLPKEQPRRILIAALVVLAFGHALFPYAGFLVVAVAMNVVFGACRAVGAVLTQSSILQLVPKHLMGRTQSAFSLIATLLQILVSFVLGWLAEHTSLEVAFALLGMLYAGAVLAAGRTRDVPPTRTKPLAAN
jgi:DHA3 family macrolide efflux protein-like MFS transporter